MKLPFQNSFQIYATPIIKQMRVKKHPKIIGHFMIFGIKKSKENGPVFDAHLYSRACISASS